MRIHKTFIRTKAIAHPVYTEIAVGQKVHFDGSATHLAHGLKAKSFSWNFGDGKTGKGEKVAHTYRRPGKYRVTLKVTDNAAFRDTDGVIVLVRSSR